MATLNETVIELLANDYRKPTRQATKIFDWLYLGDENNAFNAGTQYTHIITCLTNIDLLKTCWSMHEINPLHLQISIEDNPTVVITDYYPIVAEFLKSVDKETDKVLIHCQAGVNRSASLALMIYCNEMACSPADGVIYIWNLRPGILTNKQFRLQIDKWWEKQMKVNNNG